MKLRCVLTGRVNIKKEATSSEGASFFIETSPSGLRRGFACLFIVVNPNQSDNHVFYSQQQL